MTQRPPDSIITDAIAALYHEAELARPSGRQCIVPLNGAVAAFNLTCSEIKGLSARAAMDYLLRRGAVNETFTESNDPLAGFLYASPNFGSIFVEQEDPITRRRFSVGHELGHYLLHFRPLLKRLTEDGELFLMEGIGAQENKDIPESDDMPTGWVIAHGNESATRLLPDAEQMEREANQFAAELLMPEQVIRQLADEYTLRISGRDLIGRLAADTLVSREAMRWRLKGLGYAVP
jgi:hypothetical protein